MKTVAIVGVGLIGGSLGMALRASRKKYRIIGIGRDAGRLALAKRRGAVDETSTDLSAASKAGIIVICTPVDTIALMLEKMIPFVRPGTVITDAGSTKSSVVKGVRQVIARSGKRIDFVGAHPLAGLEKTSVAFADSSLYKAAPVVLALDARPSPRAVAAVRNMWKDAGAAVVYMTAGEHDGAVAVISHVPHVIAFNLCLLAAAANKKDPRTARLIAGSFRDMTRVAAAKPDDWAAICSGNQAEVDKQIDLFIKLLKNTKKALRSKNKLEAIFSKAKIARQKLLTSRLGD